MPSHASLTEVHQPSYPKTGSRLNIGTWKPYIFDFEACLDGCIDTTSCDFAVAAGDSLYHSPNNTKMQCARSQKHNNLTTPSMAYPIALPGPGCKPFLDRILPPAAATWSMYAGVGRSQPLDIVSLGHSELNLPPQCKESDTLDRRRPIEDVEKVPKFDRTMTDVYSDELYSPNFHITPTLPSISDPNAKLSNGIFHQRLHDANSHHLNTAPPTFSPAVKSASPFRSGSPFALTVGRKTADHHSIFAERGSQMRSGEPLRRSVYMSHQHATQFDEPETPKTISPKDALLELSDGDDDGHSTSRGSAAYPIELDLHRKTTREYSKYDASLVLSQACRSADHVDETLQMPNNSEDVCLSQQHSFNRARHLRHDSPPRLLSSTSSPEDSEATTPSSTRPRSVGADGGTYTCTYHGCLHRFDTPLLLQKHKREGHRQSFTAYGPQHAPLPSGLHSTQAGPHRCDRINPSTGKSCNTVFSRPYDLTRHEDTIHNARKQKVRCELCKEEKTFSRADALTRHFRVCHPDVELPTRFRRRG